MKFIPAKILNIVPAWERCECCDDFICNIHGVHVYDCKCPGIEYWAKIDVDPYSPCIVVVGKGAPKAIKGIRKIEIIGILK